MRRDGRLFLTATIASLLSIYDMNAFADRAISARPGTTKPVSARALRLNTKLTKPTTITSATIGTAVAAAVAASKISCSSGQYLPANAKSCSSCPSRYYLCVGGSWSTSSSDQGLVKCSSGQHADYSSNRCVSDTPAPTYTPTPAPDPTYTCSSGTYLKANQTSCSSCPSSYFKCVGGTFKKSSSDQGIQECPACCPSGQVGDASKKQCVDATYNCKEGEYLPAGEISCKQCKGANYLCLGGSGLKKSSVDQGIRQCDADYSADYNKKECVKNPPKMYTCEAKKYLPAGKTSCVDCKGANYFCSGGSFQQMDSDQGITKCNAGFEADYTAKTCVRFEFSCKAGTYLPAGGPDCATCKPNHFCVGGTYKKSSSDLGAEPCPPNTSPNKEKTKCEYGTYTCEPGTYLPAKGGKCTQCPTGKNYCPGGTWQATTIDQGKKVCPGTTIANTKRTACVLTITKEQMQYGITDKNPSQIAIDEQCWTRNTMADYVYCMFGGKLVVPFSEPNQQTDNTNSEKDSETNTATNSEQK